MVKSLWAVIRRSHDNGVRVGLAFAVAGALSLGTFALAGDITLKLDDGQAARTSAESTIQVPPTKTSPAPDPTVGAASAVLMDADTGQVLYTKNPHVKRPIASTTKIMTAILIIENCGMNDIITASKNASETPFTSLNLKPGEKITVKDLLTGMLIRSANDAAVAAAEHIAGTAPKFAAMMNKRAAEIGCTDTHFVTPNGLYDPNHYSSAYDLCLMAKCALKYPVFDEAVNTRKYTLASRTINKKDMVVFSKSKFLKDYPGADGVKSGYIKQAGYCFVGSATRDGWRLVSSVLKSENSGSDTGALMDYGFDNFQAVNVARADSDRVNVEIKGGSKGSDRSRAGARSARGRAQDRRRHHEEDRAEGDHCSRGKGDSIGNPVCMCGWDHGGTGGTARGRKRGCQLRAQGMELGENVRLAGSLLGRGRQIWSSAYKKYSPPQASGLVGLAKI